ncbi:MAG: hypothetical protein ACYSW3_30940, partial [Planctomycetota bacterium]
PIADWNEPTDETVQINDGQTTTTSGTYNLQTGSLQVTISPQAAIDTGAQWRVDGGSPAGVSMVAYNDCVYDGNDQYIANNVTTYGIGDRYTGPTSGPLLDLVTGDDMGITVTLTQSGNVTWQSQPANGGSDTAMGTDANNTFAPSISTDGQSIPLTTPTRTPTPAPAVWMSWPKTRLG